MPPLTEQMIGEMNKHTKRMRGARQSGKTNDTLIATNYMKKVVYQRESLIMLIVRANVGKILPRSTYQYTDTQSKMNGPGESLATGAEGNLSIYLNCPHSRTDFHKRCIHTMNQCA